jgi:fatty acid desaturase
MNKSIGLVILNVSTALYLIATGILGFSGLSKDSEIRQAANAIFSGNVAEVCTVILSVCAVAAGAFILLRFFGAGIGITELLLVILMIVWITFIILIDILPLINGKDNFVDFLRSIGSHLMVLGGMALATKHFGRL